MMVSSKVCIFLSILTYLSVCSATLDPIRIFDDELYLPYEWTSVKDCPVRYYDHGGVGIISPVAGQEAYEREFAHMAAIGWTDADGNINWNCGGSLISENYIVTAGHCILWHGKAPDVARMGDINLENDTDNKWAQQITIEEVIPHPLYSARYKYNDIALLKLSEPITVHDTVCPACLWINDTIRFQFMEACGYGQVGYLEDKTPKLLKVTLSPVKLEDCREYFPPDRRLHAGLKDHQICAADRAHVMDTCLGDSGGPLQIKLLGKGKMNPFLIGITSFGMSCGTDAPGVYTRVSSFIDWIESVVGIDTDPRKCAYKYAKYREYEPDVIQNKRSTMEYIDFTKFHIGGSPRYIEYIVEVWGCTGVILTEKFVLTLASCMKLQKTTSDKIKTKDGKEIKIKHVTLYPDFTSGGIDNDIALIELASEVTFNNDVRPACLYPKSHIPSEHEFNILGLGSSQNLGVPHPRWNVPEYNDTEEKALVESRSKPINYTYCNEFYEPEGIKIDEETKICYGNTDYYLVPDTCEIAPGAPIERQLYVSERWHSYAIGLPTLANDCGFGFPAVAARLSYYIDWIDSVIFPGSTKEGTSDKCVLPSGRPSSCKRASECPHLVQDISEGKRKLTDYICQFDDALDDTLVCCPAPSSDKSYDIESCPTIHRQYRRTIVNKFDDTNGDEFSHLALIGYAQTFEWHCRGNLISDKHVLTSQECFKQSSDYDAVALGNVNAIVYNIAKFITNENSLALITLDKVVSFSNTIIPICLWMDTTKMMFTKSYIVSKINSPLISALVRPYQTSACHQMKISSSITSDDQNCVKFFKEPVRDPICTSPGTGIYSIRNETGLIIPYLVGQLDDVKRVECVAKDKDAEYAFTRVAPHIDWILANM